MFQRGYNWIGPVLHTTKRLLRLLSATVSSTEFRRRRVLKVSTAEIRREKNRSERRQKRARSLGFHQVVNRQHPTFKGLEQRNGSREEVGKTRTKGKWRTGIIVVRNSRVNGRLFE